MSEQNSRFLPERVDEQVEVLSQAPMRTEHGRSASARLVAHLHLLYQEEAEIGEQVWVRLARYVRERHGSSALTPEGSVVAPSSPNAASNKRVSANQHCLFSTHLGEKVSMSPLDQQSTQSLPLQSGSDPLQEAMPRFERMSSMQQKVGVSVPRKRLSRFLGIVAAIIVGAVLISSMVLAFSLLKSQVPNSHISSGPSTFLVTPAPSFIAGSSLSCHNDFDVAEERLCSNGAETSLNVTKVFGTWKVTFLRAYADTTRLVLLFKVNESASVVNNRVNFINFTRLTTQQGITLPAEGASISCAFNETQQPSPCYQVNFDTHAIPASTTELSIQNIVDELSGKPTTLVFALPFHTAHKVIPVNQTLTNQGISLTLDHLVLTESAVSITYDESRLPQGYSLLGNGPTLTINGEVLPQTSTTLRSKQAQLVTIVISLSLLDRPGSWEIAFVVVQGTRPLFDTPWIFHFTVSK